MSDGNKTYVETELPCGCVQRRWLFGSEIIKCCAKHRWSPLRRPTRAWSSRGERSSK